MLLIVLFIPPDLIPNKKEATAKSKVLPGICLHCEISDFITNYMNQPEAVKRIGDSPGGPGTETPCSQTTLGATLKQIGVRHTHTGILNYSGVTVLEI